MPVLQTSVETPVYFSSRRRLARRSGPSASPGRTAPTGVGVNGLLQPSPGRLLVMVEFGDPALSRPIGLRQAMRHDPLHAAEIAVLYALPQLTPHVKMWWSKTSHTRSSDSPDRIANRVLRHSTSVARRGGLITGSSFYVGMLPAMAMIYCEQLIVVLRIAAAYGRDPSDPARAAEVLVVQGRYSTVQDAADALQKAGAADESRRSAAEVRTFFDVVRQFPSMIGLRLRQYTRSPIDLVIAGAEIASYLVPVVSMPVWTYASARATRRLGHAAINFYSQPVAEQTLKSSIVLPPRPKPKTRTLLIASVVPLGLTLGVLFWFLPIGLNHHGLRWVGLVISELALALTFARLIRLTRLPGGVGA